MVRERIEKAFNNLKKYLLRYHFLIGVNRAVQFEGRAECAVYWPRHAGTYTQQLSLFVIDWSFIFADSLPLAHKKKRREVPREFVKIIWPFSVRLLNIARYA
jgi:hypothetical protein